MMISVIFLIVLVPTNPASDTAIRSARNIGWISQIVSASAAAGAMSEEKRVIPTQGIFPRGHRFKMEWITAGGITAEMIEFAIVADGSDKQLEHEAVNVMAHSADFDMPIAVCVLASVPNPAAFGIDGDTINWNIDQSPRFGLPGEWP